MVDLIGLDEQLVEVRICYKGVEPKIVPEVRTTELAIRVQPNEGVYLKINSKLPGLKMETVYTNLSLNYRRDFPDIPIPEAYESLILEALKGDHSNFVRNDELDWSWRIFTPLLHFLEQNREIVPMEYAYGMLWTECLNIHH